MFGIDEQTDFAFCLCQEGQAPPASEPTDAAFPVPTLLDQRIERSTLGSAAGIHSSPILSGTQITCRTSKRASAEV
jgi:hypothetical protein